MIKSEKSSNQIELQNNVVKYSAKHYKVEEVSPQKRYGVYIRTNGSAQAEGFQKETAKKWLEANGIPISEVEFFIEHAPACQGLEYRSQLQRLLNAVKAGLVTCVLVYSRCKLARNFYEYIEIAEIFYAADIDVFFTSTETPPFSKDYLLEGIYWIQIQSEYDNIRKKLRLFHAKKILDYSSDM